MVYNADKPGQYGFVAYYIPSAVAPHINTGPINMTSYFLILVPPLDRERRQRGLEHAPSPLGRPGTKADVEGAVVHLDSSMKTAFYSMLCRNTK